MLVPAGASADDAQLLQTLSSGPEYLRAILASMYRQERILEEIRDQGRAAPEPGGARKGRA